MATIYDVARIAKVSPSTVSRIINGERNVAPATAAVVEAAIAEAGYVRKAVRPGRKPQKRQGVQTGIIDFLSLGSYSTAEMFSMPAFSGLLAGIMHEVESHGMDLVLSHCPHGKIIPPVLARRRADGVLVFGNPAMYPKVKKVLGRVPAVWCFRVDTDAVPTTSHVLYDNGPVGRMAGEYLAGRGHKRLAVLNTTPGHLAFAERQAGFSAAVQAMGLEAAVIESRAKPPFEDVGVRAQPLIEELIALDPRPTGVFCVSDDLMLAVYNGLKQRGITPGKEIELIGCNNDAMCLEHMHPRPATIDLKLGQVGRQAVNRLIWEMSNPEERDVTGTYIQPALVPAV